MPTPRYEERPRRERPAFYVRADHSDPVNRDQYEPTVHWDDLEQHGIVPYDATPKNFGRIAAQTAKQVILQRIREVERDMMYEEYQDRVGDVVTGIVQQADNRYCLVDLGIGALAISAEADQLRHVFIGAAFDVLHDERFPQRHCVDLQIVP